MPKREFFVYTVSDPAPFCGDSGTEFVKAATAHEAFTHILSNYGHPAGLHFVAVYVDANAYHKGNKPLAEFKHRCPYEKAKRQYEKGK